MLPSQLLIHYQVCPPSLIPHLLLENLMKYLVRNLYGYGLLCSAGNQLKQYFRWIPRENVTVELEQH